MRIEVIGGRAGRARFRNFDEKSPGQETDVRVFERNRPDDTFGFGVVFSDEPCQTF